ncbi:unnamed protein product, partial [Rotaria sp. Silwood1]
MVYFHSLFREKTTGVNVNDLADGGDFVLGDIGPGLGAFSFTGFLYVILFTLVLLIGFCTSTDQLLARTSLQDYVDSFVHDGKVKLLGHRVKLNNSVIRQIWSFFKAKYHCLYPSDGEEKSRLRLFIKHLKYVILSNFQESNTYQLTLNRFSDWTLAEFRTYKTGAKVPSHLQRRTMDDELDEDALQISSAKLHQRHYEAKRLRRNLRKRRHQDKRFGDDWFYKYFNRNSANTKPNNTVDWRTKNVVSSVKNQGDCAFCYAFAATAVLESLYAIKTKSDKVIEFSPQQIVNCSKENGCNKIATDASYPYNYTEESCQINGINEIDLGEVQLETIPVDDEEKLAEAVTNNGPIYLGINSNFL